MDDPTPFGLPVDRLSALEIAAVFDAGHGVFGLLYGLVVYEFFYWLQHWLAHKVRLLWCIHSPHHAPPDIHMAIGANHHFLEGLLYFPLFFGLLPAIFGVEPVVLVCLNVLDMVWGSFLHVSPEFVREGRYGLIRRFMQTPAHHRVHHGKNPRYIDRNYNSITLFWDWVFGTLEPLDDAESVEFGITRPVQAGSYWDVHFGEFVALFRDMRSAQSLFEAGSYLIKPPGWAPGDDRQTARAIRARYSDGRINGRTHEAQEARR